MSRQLAAHSACWFGGAAASPLATVRRLPAPAATAVAVRRALSPVGSRSSRIHGGRVGPSPRCVAVRSVPPEVDAADDDHDSAVAAADDDATTTSGGGGIEDDLAALVAPAARLQPVLSGKERAALRAQAEALAHDKRLEQVRLGASGVTPNVLAGIMDVLQARAFVRVRLGVGGARRKALAAALERLLDAACVHQVGHTATLYRRPGLARPEGCSCSGNSSGGGKSSSDGGSSSV